MKTRLKRYTGSLIDFLLFILFFYLFTLFFSNVIVPNNPTYQANSEKMNEIMLSSGLFEENSKGDIVDVDDNYDEVLTEFYKTYPYVDANKDHFSSYEDAKRKSGLFHEVSDGVFVVNEDASELDLGIFYTSQLYNAKVSLFNYSDYKNYYDYNNNLIYWGSIGCIVLSSAIFYLILPLCLKGKSIGRLIFRMELLSQDDKPASIMQRIVRYIAFLMIVVLMSLWLYFIPLGINLIIYFIDKKNRGIPDLLAVTYVKEREDWLWKEKKMI